MSAAVIAVAAAGCGNNGGEDARDEPGVDIRSVGDMNDFVLPLDPYRITFKHQQLMNRAFGVLYRSCMKRFAFTVEVAPESNSDPINNSRRYGIASADYAQRYGYHYHNQSDSAVDARRQRPVSEDENAVSRGTGITTHNGQKVPTGGCSGEARRTLEASLPTVPDERLGDKLSSKAYESSKLDSRVKAVFAQWSQCMMAAGHNYSNPMDAISDAPFRGTQITAAEIETAKTDVDCKQKTSLLDVWGSVEIAYQQRALESNGEELERVHDRLTAQESRASKILSEADLA